MTILRIPGPKHLTTTAATTTTATTAAATTAATWVPTPEPLAVVKDGWGVVFFDDVANQAPEDDGDAAHAALFIWGEGVDPVLPLDVGVLW